MATVAIVILNFNGLHFLKKYLQILVDTSPGHQVIVADNGSKDLSIAYLRKEHPAVRIIEIKQNLGFAGGYNFALKEVNTDYFVIINSDVQTTDHWLDPLVAFLETNPNYSAVQPKILNAQNPNQFEYAGAAGGFIDAWGYHYCRGRIFDFSENDLQQYDTPVDVFWTSGACMLIRADDFKAQNGFDTDFLAHMEEIDLCWRLAQSGKKLKCIPASKVYHVGGGTLSKNNPHKTYLNYRNGLIMLLKNLPTSALIKIPIRMIVDVLSGLFFWRKLGFAHFKSILKAEWMFLLSFRQTWSKRVTSKDKVAIGKSALHSVVFDHFVRGKKNYKEID